MIAAANVGLRFVLELCALVAYGYWGFQTGHGPLSKIALGIGIPLLAAVIWGLFGAPHSTTKVTGIVHLMLEVAVFGTAAVALYAAGKHGLAGAFGLALVINRVLMFIWRQ
jgi:hypothetical protein